jgi:hypothetical protein
MTDVSPGLRQIEQVAANDHDEQRDVLSTGWLQEVFNSIFAGSRDTTLDASNNPLGARNLLPDIAISNAGIDPYAYGGDTGGQQNVPPFDPHLNKIPQESQPEPNPPSDPPKPDAPPPEGDRQTKMGDRMFTVHPDGTAEYTVTRGDCVWYVATDVLKSRTGQDPDDAHIFAEVNAIAVASGLLQNGRNPDLIYPGDKLVIPPAEKADDQSQPQPKQSDRLP